MKVVVHVSAHHLHLTREDLDILFGKGYELHKYKDLLQIGQYASEEKVTIKTEKGEMTLRVLGPTRSYTQIEISKTDAYKLGINPPVRTSGDIKDSAKVTIIGPNGIIENKEGVIIADRHIHMTKEEADEYGFTDGEEVMVKVNTIKGGIMDHVIIRAKDNSYYEMHIDTDDANAFLLNGDEEVEIIKKN